MISNNEKSIVLRAQGGDREAVGTLWDMFTPKLFGYLMNTVRNRALAEDVLQATWLKAVDALPRFESRGVSIGAWLFAIARNECSEHWRKTGRETAFDIEEHDVPDVGGSKIENKILTDQILASLSEDDRELLRLRYIADLPVKDIANLLELNFVTVRVRIHRAIANVRDILISNNNKNYEK
ncbi:MAG: RNA polymerase sigma factor [bacterium]|nr:RNA polymerase sigma factor [bacterium]